MIKEITPPEGYVISSSSSEQRAQVYPVTGASLTIKNHPATKEVKVCIRDAATQQWIPNTAIVAGPVITNYDYMPIQNRNWQIFSCNIISIPYGTWTLTGVTPPNGYSGNPVITGIVIDKDRPTPVPLYQNGQQQPTDPNEPGLIILDYDKIFTTVEINKFDLATGTPLS